MHIQRLLICVIVLFLVIIRRHEELIAIKTEHNVELKSFSLMGGKAGSPHLRGQAENHPQARHQKGPLRDQIALPGRIVLKTQLFWLQRNHIARSMNHLGHSLEPAEGR